MMGEDDMTLTTTQLHPCFFAEISGVDLTKPVASDVFSVIKSAFDKHAILLFRNQPVDDVQQVDFSELFGPVFTSTKYHRDGEVPRLGDKMSDISNIGADDAILPADDHRRLHAQANALWHTDNSFKHIPSRCSLLSAREIPPSGGNTEFADMRAAYDALPESKKRAIDSLIVEHSIFRSREQLGYDGFSDGARAELPPVQQVLVRTLPDTGRKALYIASHASHVTGDLDAEGSDWPLEKSRELITELIDFATQPQFVHTHVWRPDDLIVWDNRCTMHRARPYEASTHRRVLHRTTVSDEINSVEQAWKTRAV
jgi:alpha-ketoglutarate-dependent 2,4-dichlorophenoxyacetate dioxygenase